jgi:Fe-S cluster assembly iron-binding protein IscA
VSIMKAYNNEENPKKEGNMLEITEKASDMIKDFLKERDEVPAIRIMLSQGG